MQTESTCDLARSGARVAIAGEGVIAGDGVGELRLGEPRAEGEGKARTQRGAQGPLSMTDAPLVNPFSIKRRIGTLPHRKDGQLITRVSLEARDLQPLPFRS